MIKVPLEKRAYPFDRFERWGSLGGPLVIDLSYPTLLDLFREHIAPKRNESASFLIWYLENYYRLDTQEAVDAVCDQRGDKGVDGIFVNDNDLTITVSQSTISQKAKSSIGDSALREFAGTLRQFDSPETVQHLISSAGNADVASLARRLDLANKVLTHQVRGEYLSNIELDNNGESYLKTAPNISFLGRNKLFDTFISNSRDVPHGVDPRFETTG